MKFLYFIKAKIKNFLVTLIHSSGERKSESSSEGFLHHHGFAVLLYRETTSEQSQTLS